MRYGIIVLLVLVLMATAGAVGPHVRRSCLLGWDANMEQDLAGYRVYVSTTTPVVPDGVSYALQVASGTTSATCRQIGAVAYGQQYYVVVTAIDTADPVNESTASGEIAIVLVSGQVLIR